MWRADSEEEAAARWTDDRRLPVAAATVRAQTLIVERSELERDEINVRVALCYTLAARLVDDRRCQCQSSEDSDERSPGCIECMADSCGLNVELRLS